MPCLGKAVEVYILRSNFSGSTPLVGLYVATTKSFLGGSTISLFLVLTSRETIMLFFEFGNDPSSVETIGFNVSKEILYSCRYLDSDHGNLFQIKHECLNLIPYNVQFCINMAQSLNCTVSTAGCTLCAPERLSFITSA